MVHARESAMTRPNVLFILTDDQRFDTISGLGNPAIDTPNFDRLLHRGTAFTRACIMGGSHRAVCMPSRAMVHTGRTLYHLDRQGQSIPVDHTMLGEHLRSHGYHSWGCGKWHNGKESFNRSFADGEEIYLGGMCDHWNVPAYHYDPTGAYAGTLPICVDPMTSKQVNWRDADHVVAGKHSSELLADCGVRFLETYDHDEPFFAYVATLAPHDPRVMPQDWLDRYDLDAVHLPASFMPEHPFDNGELGVRDEKLAGFPRTEAEIREHVRDYYAMISHLDHEIGRVLDALDASGKAEDTIVVLAGDNGLAVGRHGLMGKQNMYEHSIRVPLVMAGPGIPRGEVRDALCYLIDVYPTLCDLLDLPTPASVEGRSLARVLVDAKAQPPRTVLHFAYRGVQRAVTNGRHKLIRYHVKDESRIQLFDLQSDPEELHDLSKEPEMAALIDDLQEELRRWQTDYDDDQPDQGAEFWR